MYTHRYLVPRPIQKNVQLNVPHISPHQWWCHVTFPMDLATFLQIFLAPKAESSGLFGLLHGHPKVGFAEGELALLGQLQTLPGAWWRWEAAGFPAKVKDWSMKIQERHGYTHNIYLYCLCNIYIYINICIYIQFRKDKLWNGMQWLYPGRSWFG